MSGTTDKISFLLNWYAISFPPPFFGSNSTNSSFGLLFDLDREATPYHAPLFLAQSKGYFKEEGVSVAILEPNDPSDVTEMIGAGGVNMGFKAMVHTIAGKARGFPVKSVGSLMDEVCIPSMAII